MQVLGILLLKPLGCKGDLHGMQCSFIPIRVQQNAEHLRASKIIIKWLLYVITSVFLEASLHHGNVPNVIYVTAR